MSSIDSTQQPMFAAITPSTPKQCPGVVSRVQCPASPKVTDEFVRSFPPHGHTVDEASAQRVTLRRGEARMQPGLSLIEQSTFCAASAVWFIADDGARIIVISNEQDLAKNLLRGERPEGAGRLFMKVGGSFLERLSGRVTGTWQGKIGMYEWQQGSDQHSTYSRMPQQGRAFTEDTLADGGALRGYFSGSSTKNTQQGELDVHFVGGFLASPINLSSAPSLRNAIGAMTR